MIIEKKGLIYCPKGELGWDAGTFMTPHAIQLEEGRIRIYGGVRDDLGVSRIRYIDVEEGNPGNVLDVGSTPSLDIGNPGCFDDNGVIGLEFVTSYSFNEQLSDNVILINFDNAMSALKEGISKNVDVARALEGSSNSNLTFNHIELMYYPLESPDKTECTYVPAWVVDAGSGNMIDARVVINAVDGTYITTIYSE